MSSIPIYDLQEKFTHTQEPPISFSVDLSEQRSPVANLSVSHSCYGMLQPGAQVKDLIILVIRLMLSWEDPMSHLKAQAVRLPKVPPSFRQKAELIQRKRQQLLEGLKIIARQVGSS